MILTRKSHNCAGTAFVQGNSAGGSKLIEQTLPMHFSIPKRSKLSFLAQYLLSYFKFKSGKLFRHPKTSKIKLASDRVMEIAKRSGHCITRFYVNVSESDIKSFIKYLGSVPNKLIETKNPPRKLFIILPIPRGGGLSHPPHVFLE